ncbi:pre-rRNA-processing protein TSR1 homolog isoform X2 [Acanthaster planci]|uniref:Pre-rRNA-processing protein TSR1 homolog n=1 Tax=Acanthaster planci TaxID=133434 RepID=A0A8B7Z3K5_ACAPL|nr:pre-rRNA-processing protein TSR1 homolog isoform X2 [Acanthaster planci]
MAANSGQETHRSGPFKQQNKAHKTGRHRSKGQIETQGKGRVNVKTQSKKNRHEISKVDRRHQALQRRQHKREETLARKRSIGGRDSAPHLVAVIGLHSDCDVKGLVEQLQSCDETSVQSPSANENISDLSIPRFKHRLTFLTPPPDLTSVLDAAKVADSLLCVISPSECWDTWGDLCLSCLFSQGLPATTVVTRGLDKIPVKKRNEARKVLQKTVERRFADEKLYTFDTEQEGLLLLRHITEQRLKPIKWKDARSHLLARVVNFEPNQDQEAIGTLKVTGFLRGSPLSVNGLVHLPGLGSFQMSQIDATPDPCPLTTRVPKKKPKESNSMDMESGDHQMEEGVVVLEQADPAKQESLDSEAIPDPMEGEQTWPTEEELAQAEAALKEANTTKTSKRVPKGTSEYQATWIIDSDHEDEPLGESDDDTSDDNDDDDGDFQDAVSQIDSDDGRLAPSQTGTDMDYETISITEGNKANYDADYDEEQEKAMLEKYREERMQVMFPDEVDTPMDVPARQRFARYRGLKSFRTSPWDPKENLPQDYARIFQFENFNRTRKRIVGEERAGGAQTGNYITIHISNVPRSFFDDFEASSPLVIFGLLPHEQKMSVMHMAIKRYHNFTEPVKAKERLIFQVGFRQFSACPILSQHSNGDKHKYIRFLPKDDIVVATVYAPIAFPPATVLVFKENTDGTHSLVATGSLLAANPDRIVAKKLVLSGHPLKIINKQAVVRYMFFNREDILWFKPVELHTKWGRRGHIKEPLGTHGHMKCIFDGKLKSQDTVLLNLYKRVYPKWTYDPVGTRTLNISASMMVNDQLVDVDDDME